MCVILLFFHNFCLILPQLFKKSSLIDLNFPCFFLSLTLPLSILPFLSIYPSSPLFLPPSPSLSTCFYPFIPPLSSSRRRLLYLSPFIPSLSSSHLLYLHLSLSLPPTFAFSIHLHLSIYPSAALPLGRAGRALDPCLSPARLLN